MHLTALELFTKHFFAHDKLNYARLMPLYIAEMKSMKSALTKEFRDGNRVVNKNMDIPFCALGADHALKHINRSMKVAGGLIGITLNPKARTKFFLIAPELAKLAGEARQVARISSDTHSRHHALSKSVLLRQEKNTDALTTILRSSANPFNWDSADLCNFMTKAIMPQKVQDDLCGQREIGDKLFKDFVAQRIKSKDVNLWAPMKKYQLQTWVRASKQMKVDTGDKIVELKEDRNLFGRMLLVSKSRPELSLEEAVGKHELSVVPRSMFAADGTMLHCHMKSSLMAILEKLPDQETESPGNPNEIRDNDDKINTGMKVAIVDGMAEVHMICLVSHNGYRIVNNFQNISLKK